MESLEHLRDIANGKRRRFFNVSPKAADFFKQWILDYQAAATLEEVLDQYEMGHSLGEHLRAKVQYEGKRVKIEVVAPRAPWDCGDNNPEPYNFNDEVTYLVLSFIINPKCERLRLCPECGKCYIALRPQQKYCGGLCGRRAASRRVVNDTYGVKRQKRIEACRAAYEKYQRLRRKPRSVHEYVLVEANRHLPRDYRIGGLKLQVNFITRNAGAIGIPEGGRNGNLQTEGS